MNIQYASDLHLEFADNEEFLRYNNLVPKADVLVLAGDIVNFHLMDDKAWFFDYLSQNFKTTYWVPGNHEYYHADLSVRSGSLLERIRPNVFLVNDYAVTIDDARLIFATMWTSIKPTHQFAIERRMNDFHLIRKMGNRLTCADLEKEHKVSLAFIKKELAEEAPDLKKIVVTHHVPTFMNYPPEYFGDVLNDAFAVNLTDYIFDHGPDYWIYGHHHQNIPDFIIGKTQLLTNQLGYVRYQENALFSNQKTISLDNNINRQQRVSR
ncbi:MAG: metallophosphoesterase [Bacteroidota bacterium]|nr:metallophosphoesterase [Bacteroidota bacterium]